MRRIDEGDRGIHVWPKTLSDAESAPSSWDGGLLSIGNWRDLNQLAFIFAIGVCSVVMNALLPIWISKIV